MRFVRSFGRFCYAFLMGEEWLTLAFAVAALALMPVIEVWGPLGEVWNMIIAGTLGAVVFALCLLYGWRRW
jgi:ABC-type phosphate/phosphonate transport system permease subunit